MREKLIDVFMHLGEHIRPHEEYGLLFDTPLCEAVEYVIQMLKNGVTVQEWISVKDRLPTREDANETESILAINKHEGYVGRWIWDIVVDYPQEFTHWMPLPQPPKGE